MHPCPLSLQQHLEPHSQPMSQSGDRRDCLLLTMTQCHEHHASRCIEGSRRVSREVLHASPSSAPLAAASASKQRCVHDACMNRNACLPATGGARGRQEGRKREECTPQAKRCQEIISDILFLSQARILVPSLMLFSEESLTLLLYL